MHFQISLSLLELQVIKELLRVRDIAEKPSNRLLLLLLFKKITFHLKPTVLKSLFNKVARLRACNFFAKTVNKPLTIVTKNFMLDVWHGSKYASESQT